MTEGEEVDIVLAALGELEYQDPVWARNYNAFFGMDRNGRIWWWRMAKKNAEAGVPAMQKLLLKTIELRLTS